MRLKVASFRIPCTLMTPEYLKEDTTKDFLYLMTLIYPDSKMLVL